MADQMLEKIQEVFEGQIDFEGQRQADFLTTGLLATAGAIAFIVGYTLQNIYLSLYIGLGGTALTFLVVVPPWPYFNKTPVNWLPAATTASGIGIEVDGKKVN
ncbi:MAG: hypothetical protein M1827_003544 [Pycnora praestabilis]|nr:MAG: hypothetical protein M1827_003544 [Pycnora praestabilis]